MVAGHAPRTFCAGPMPHDCGSSDAPAHEGYFPAFVNNLVSPFMSCWHPHIGGCMTPGRPRASAPPVVVSPQKHPQQTTNIREPRGNDVLCGRGGSSNRHVGNLNFRALVTANKDMYVTLTKKQKMMVARKIVEAIHNQEPPGRFLQKDPQTGFWFDIGLPRSLEKTSQALREKTQKDSQPETPASPGGSSFTAVTIATEDTFSDPGVSAPTLKTPPLSPTVSPAGTAASSPVPSSVKSSLVGTNEIPSISIPEHLEAQFRPRRAGSRPPPPPPPPPRWNRDYPPPPHHHPYPPPQHYPPPYPDHQDYYHHHRPPPVYSAPYPPAPPPPSLPPMDHREHYPSHVRSSPPVYPRLPPPSYPPSSPPHHIPPSPDRRDYESHSPRANMIKSSGSAGRQTSEVSPGRAQAWKKRRTGTSTTDESLTRAMESGLSLQEGSSRSSDSRPPDVDELAELKSPSSILQSRSRRSFSNGDALSGLAALSSAALLKLDEGKK